MKDCPNCKKEINNGSNFCSYCGITLVEEVSAEPKLEHQKLLEVFSSWNNVEVGFVKSLLETNGIKCFIFDENIIRLNPLSSLAISGIKIKVPKEYIEKAKEIINLHCKNLQEKLHPEDVTETTEIVTQLEDEITEQKKVNNFQYPINFTSKKDILEALKINDLSSIKKFIDNNFTKGEKLIRDIYADEIMNVSKNKTLTNQLDELLEYIENKNK